MADDYNFPTGFVPPAARPHNVPQQHPGKIDPRKPRAQPRAPQKPQAPERDGYSLAGISAEAAGILLAEPLMQNAPDADDSKPNLGNLRNALQKVHDGETLSGLDEVLLSKASILVNPSRAPNATHPVGVEAFKDQELMAERDSFDRAAAPYAKGFGPLRA